MLRGLLATEKEVICHNLVVVRGSDPYLRDRVISWFHAVKRIDASKFSEAEVVSQIQARTFTDEEGAVIIQNAECLQDNDHFDQWIHKKNRRRTAVLVVSVGGKLLPHYGRVTGRRGVIVDCDLYAKDSKILDKWVRDRAIRKRVNISSYLLGILLVRCGDLLSVEYELDKLMHAFSGKVITKDIVDSFVVDRGGGIPVVSRMLFDGSSECLTFAAKSLDRGLDVSIMIGGLVREIVQRIRMLKAGPPIPRAAQTLRIDQRLAPVYSEQALRAGEEYLWRMIRELSALLHVPVVAEIRFFKWLEDTCDHFHVLRGNL